MSGPKNVPASVRQRLLNLSRENRTSFNEILARYAIERFLYRLGTSTHRNSFILKGATLFALWNGEPHRATRDLDLLGFGENTAEHLERVFREVAAIVDPEDGIVFVADTIQGQPIREELEYGGIRITLLADLAGARIPMQIDIGFGDVVQPQPLETTMPTLLGLAAPRLRAYPPETVVAEKFQAMVLLGEGNSRLKDYYDIWFLANTRTFEGSQLARAIASTFACRSTLLPEEVPVGLSDDFAGSIAKQAQWKGFLRRAAIAEDLAPLEEIILALRAFLMPPTIALGAKNEFQATWQPAGPWVASVPDKSQ